MSKIAEELKQWSIQEKEYQSKLKHLEEEHRQHEELSKGLIECLKCKSNAEDVEKVKEHNDYLKDHLKVLLDEKSILEERLRQTYVQLDNEMKQSVLDLDKMNQKRKRDIDKKNRVIANLEEKLVRLAYEYTCIHLHYIASYSLDRKPCRGYYY